jgi:16S rRNA (uracil1498-N3)-methyltransferase
MFYLPHLPAETAIGDIFTLNAEESLHCARVLRLGIGDPIEVSNGAGWIFRGNLVISNPKGCTVKIITKDFFPKNRGEIHLAVAPTKNINRYEWFLEKATEIGIDEITPLICSHSERQNLRIDRLNKVISSAVKQSLNSWHPSLHEPASFAEFIKQVKECQKFIAYVDEQPRPHLKNLYTPGNSAIVLIGPEGDFSPDEIELSIKNGYKAVSLGASRLRTETAAVVACHTLNLSNC